MMQPYSAKVNIARSNSETLYSLTLNSALSRSSILNSGTLIQCNIK